MKKEKKYCVECDSEDIKKLAKWECVNCGEGYCNKCEKNLMNECSQCPPPFLKKIK